MVRKIAFRNTRVPPAQDKEGETDPREERKHVRLVTDDLRNDIAITSQTAPDMRDRIQFTSNGDVRQQVSHKVGYTPDVYAIVVVGDGDDDNVYSAVQYKQADSGSVYIKTNAPSGSTIIVMMHPRGS